MIFNKIILNQLSLNLMSLVFFFMLIGKIRWWLEPFEMSLQFLEIL
jgi:hypothetical protein